jgi:hypothetical protein
MADFDWKTSASKELLRRDIVAGRLPAHWKPAKVWEEYQNSPEFVAEKIDKDKLGARLRSLRKTLSDRHDRAARDAAALVHDRVLFPAPAQNHRGKPRWQGSLAEQLLKSDIDQGRHKSMTPLQLYNSRPVYVHACDLTTFRNHIYQDQRRRKFAHYLEVKKQKEVDAAAAAAADNEGDEGDEDDEDDEDDDSDDDSE